MVNYKIRVGNLFVKIAFNHEEETVIHLTSDISEAAAIRDKDEAILKGKLCKREFGNSVNVDVVSEQLVSEIVIEEETE